MIERLNYLISFIYINLFISFYIVRTDLNKFLFFLIFSLIVSTILLFYEANKKNYFTNFFNFDKNEKILFFLLIIDRKSVV